MMDDNDVVDEDYYDVGDEEALGVRHCSACRSLDVGLPI